MRLRRRTLALIVLNVAQVLLGAALFVVHTEAAAATTPVWGWPLPGDSFVDRPFRPPATAWGAGHRGVDLRGEQDESVLAAGPGQVTYAGLLAGRGVVTVTHGNGLRTTYEPVSPVVGVGTRVEHGDVLGTLTSGHGSCRPGTTCLHWGLLRGETYLDPLALITQGRLQLLPVKDSAAPPALQAATVSRIAPSLSPGPQAVTHPRKRAGVVFLNGAVNVATVVALAWIGFVGSRRLWRLVRRRR